MTDLSYDKLKNSSVDEIYNFFQAEYLNIFNDYNYIFKTYSEFLVVIKNIIKDIINNLPNKTSLNYKNYLINQSVIKLNKYVKKSLEQEDKMIIITSYIMQNIDDSQNSLNEFKKLIKWFQLIDYVPDPSIIIELVTNNQKLKKILSKIVEQNLNRMQKYGIESILSEELAFEFLDIYCNVNDVIDNNISYHNDKEDQSGTYLGASAFIKELRAQKLYVLSKEEEKELFIKFNNGDEDAYNKILYHNLRLVLNIANRYINRGLEYEDLIQEGNIGLLTAISRYDVTKGFRFSTYAIWWIRQALMRAIGNNSRNIRVPIHKMEKLNKFWERVKMLESKLGYFPSYAEIAKYLKLKYEEVENNFELLQTPTSLNMKIGEEDVELGDIIPSSFSSNLEDDFISDNLVKEVDDLLVKAGLTEMERAILKYRYGLNYSEEKILEDIGRIYGVTRERIRQKESTAIIKLRKYAETKNFAAYLDNPDKARAQLEKMCSWHYLHPKSSAVYNLSITDDKIIEKPKKAKRRLKTIYEMIPDYSKEEIDAAIARLDENDKQIFYLRNGDDLDNPENKQKVLNLNYSYGLVVDKIKRNLKRPNKIKTIYECLNKYSREEIDKGISMLSDDDKKIIFYRYGNDLEHPVTSPLWNSVKYHGILYVNIFHRIERNIELIKKSKKEGSRLKMPKKLISIYDQLSEYSKEEIDAEIAKLKDEDKKIFYLRNGDNLELPISAPEFNSKMRTRYYSIVNLMKIHLKTNSKYLKGTIYYQLNKLNSNYTKEDYNRAITMLSASEKAIIFARYGEDLDKPIDPKTRKFSYQKVNQVLNRIIIILSKTNEINDVSNDLREFYIRAIELLKSPVLMKLLLNISIKEAIILAIIILSYLENRDININDIANLLEVDVNDLQKDYRRMLLMFKENINNYLNLVLDNLDNNDLLKK